MANKCENCICNPVCDHNKYGFENCNNFQNKSLIVELPVKVGQTVYVDSRTLPTGIINLFAMGIYDDEMPKFFEGKVISIRQNCKGWFVKIGITAHWIKSYWDDEIGEDFYTSHMSKYFTYPKGAFGITVFLTKEDAEAKLKEFK